MKLANCIEHPRTVDPTLTCWAVRHENLTRATPEEIMAELRRLHAALLRYGHHDGACRCHEDGPETCDCGLDDACRVTP